MNVYRICGSKVYILVLNLGDIDAKSINTIQTDDMQWRCRRFQSYIRKYTDNEEKRAGSEHIVSS